MESTGHPGSRVACRASSPGLILRRDTVGEFPPEIDWREAGQASRPSEAVVPGPGDPRRIRQQDLASFGTLNRRGTPTTPSTARSRPRTRTPSRPGPARSERMTSPGNVCSVTGGPNDRRTCSTVVSGVRRRPETARPAEAPAGLGRGTGRRADLAGEPREPTRRERQLEAPAPVEQNQTGPRLLHGVGPAEEFGGVERVAAAEAAQGPRGQVERRQRRVVLRPGARRVPWEPEAAQEAAEPAGGLGPGPVGGRVVAHAGRLLGSDLRRGRPPCFAPAAVPDRGRSRRIRRQYPKAFGQGRLSDG